MGTLEHVPRHLVEPYLKRLAGMTDEYCIITVPNELGVVFLIKHMIKRVSGDYPHYTIKEIINTVLGRTHLVFQKEHKGFNYRFLIKQVSKYFDVIEVSGYPFTFLPPILNLGIGIVAKNQRFVDA